MNGAMRQWQTDMRIDVRADDPRQAAVVAVRRLRLAKLTQGIASAAFVVNDGKTTVGVPWGAKDATLDDHTPTHSVLWRTIVTANTPFNAAGAARMVQLYQTPPVVLVVTTLATKAKHILTIK